MCGLLDVAGSGLVQCGRVFLWCLGKGVTTLYHCGCSLSINVVVCALVVARRRPDCPSPVVTRGFLSPPPSSQVPGAPVRMGDRSDADLVSLPMVFYLSTLPLLLCAA